MQSQNRIFDDLARVAGGALGALSGLREEIEQLVRGRMERALADMDLVQREEFDAVKAMAAEARAENERLAARLAELEGKQMSAPKKAAAAAAVPAASRRRSVRRDVGTAKKPAKAKTSSTPNPPTNTPPKGPEDKE